MRICESWATRAPVGQYSIWPGMTNSFWRRCGFKAIYLFVRLSFIFIVGEHEGGWVLAKTHARFVFHWNISRFSAQPLRHLIGALVYDWSCNRLLYEPTAKPKDAAAKVLWDVHLPGTKHTCIKSSSVAISRMMQLRIWYYFRFLAKC